MFTRPLAQLHPHLIRLLRSASSSVSPPPYPPSSSTTSPRPPVSPTTFSEKSAPQPVYERPEQIRGFPPSGVRPLWQAKDKATPDAGGATSSKGEAFDGPSRPRLLNDRRGRRELPSFENRIPIYIALGTLGLGAWALFLLYATNAERLASSVMRSLAFQLRNSPEVASILGKRVKLEEPWYVLGDPWISGSVNNMQGRIDLKFRVKGDQDAGTVYFTSIRPAQGDPWRIVRYKLIADSGPTLRLEDQADKI